MSLWRIWIGLAMVKTYVINYTCSWNSLLLVLVHIGFRVLFVYKLQL